MSDTIPSRLLDGLNDRQREAVESLAGPLLVVAGPGSGKTRVLTHRIAALVATGVAPWRILAVTFTNKAAAEMRDRLGQLLGDEVEQMWVGTFHSICARLLRVNHQAAGLPSSFSILDESDSLRVLRDVCAARGLDTDRKELRRYRERISWAKNHDQTPEQVARESKLFAIGDVMLDYVARLDVIGACDFDDLLVRTLRMLETHPDVADRYQERFEHVLVDEFQDTNVVQYDIVRLLAARRRNLCVVGDHDQSIYRWRGSTPDVLERFDQDWPGCKVVALSQNYRSTGRIVAASRSLIERNPSRHRGDLWTDNDDGEPVVLYLAADDRDEAAWTVQAILERQRAGGALHENAVLMRTNAQTRSLEEELTRARVGYQVVGALRFYERAEIKDAVAWLRLVVNGADQVAFARAVAAPRRGIGATTLGAVLDVAGQESLDAPDAARLLLERGEGGRGSRALGGFLAAFDRVAAACERGPAAGLIAVLDDAGLRDALVRDPDGESRLENVEELVVSATRFETTATGDGLERCVEFLSTTALASPEDQDADSNDRVQLLTAHSAKGKEFDHVAVVGAEEGLFPHRRAVADGNEAELAEERRLFYVAVSRARQTLTISACASRLAYGDIIENDRSRFLADLPDDVEIVESPLLVHGRRPLNPGSRSGRRGTSRSPGQGPMTRVVAQRGAVSRSSAPWAPSRQAVATPGPRVRADQLVVGARVKHGRFGDGKVRSVRRDRREAMIEFADGEKLLGLDHAPLELV